MATGPEHYRAAEELLITVHALKAKLQGVEASYEAIASRISMINVNIAEAQAHATLALAAATAQNIRRNGGTGEWAEVLNP